MAAAAPKTPPKTITDTVEVGGSPGSPNVGKVGAAPMLRALTSDPTKEYISGVNAGQTWYLNMARALAPYIDNLQEGVGLDVYERMCADPQVLACINVFKAGVFETGPSFSSSIDDEDDPDYAKAQFIADWCAAIFLDLKTSIDDVLWNMGDAFYLGNKVAELVYSYSDQYWALPAPKPKQQYGPNGEKLPLKPLPVYRNKTGGPQLILTDIKVKPRESVGFLVDAFMNTLGILGRIPGQFFPIMPGMVYADISKIPNLLPLDKFAVMTFRPKDSSPLGTSMLHPAYQAFFIKEQLWTEYGKFLSQMAGGMIVGKPDPTAPAEAPAQDENGQSLGFTATREDTMLQTLKQGRNGAVLVVQPGAEVDINYPTSDGAAFLAAFELLNLEMTKGILHVTLATEEGKHQSRSAAEVHVDILQVLIRVAKQSVERMIRSILQRMISFNYGDDARRLVPVVSLGETDEGDKSKNWTALAALMQSGYLSLDQLPQTDQENGLPVRVPPDPADLAAQAAAKQTALNPPPQPQALDANGQPVPPNVASTSASQAQRGTDGGLQPENMPIPGKPSKPAVPPPKGTRQFAKGRTVTVSAKPKPADLKRVEAAYKEWASENQAALLKSVS